MKNLFLSVILITVFVSCQQNNKFKVEGTVVNAKGEKLYLENNGLVKTILLDSVVLDENGSFKFSSPKPLFPDFYSLRLNNKSIIFSIDSSESITISSQIFNFANEYKISGSTTSLEIQQLRKSILDIQQKLNNLSKNENEDSTNAIIERIKVEIEIHKTMAKKLILQNPRSIAAYFAIYQKINNSYIFSPYNKEDRPYCAAVATSYNTFMPEYERSKNLYSLVMDAIKTDRQSKEKELWQKVMDERGKGFIDIVLNDKNKTECKLSALEGKVVLIDFSAYESKESVDYTFGLRELYNKYHNKGFEIYQISLDRNKIIWEQSVENIPWICVRDEAGPETSYVATYNISSLPTTFLMNKKGEIISRDLNFKDLENAISSNL